MESPQEVQPTLPPAQTASANFIRPSHTPTDHRRSAVDIFVAKGLQLGQPPSERADTTDVLERDIKITIRSNFMHSSIVSTYGWAEFLY
jgi:hypothetical protein